MFVNRTIYWVKYPNLLSGFVYQQKKISWSNFLRVQYGLNEERSSWLERY
jgi:hypothetical protein